ncbi:MAG: FAD-binding protein [Alphaproteobacteria bacterium]|nr:FAD-binding protein [Alphaproteobacteria bacterium]
MTILILAEHDHQNLKSATYATISAAQKIGGDIHVLIAGSKIQSIVNQASKIAGIQKILVADHAAYEHLLAEDITDLTLSIAKEYEYILAPATAFGKNIAPRIAALLDVQQISDVMEILGQKTYKRPIYAGNAITTIQSSDAKQVLTIRATCFDQALKSETASPQIEIVQGKQAQNQSRFVSQELTISVRPELTAAKVVISGGRGLQNGENFKLLEDLADRLGAAIGASRAAVDAGYVPNDYQVGQTGKVVAPDLYIAVGISGAIQHLAGMKDSKVIVAINKDEEAPIFQISDYYLVQDLFTAIPEFCQEIDKIRGNGNLGQHKA